MHEELVKILLDQQSQALRPLSPPWKLVSVRAPINIALIKYWGKNDEDLIIPSNDSISITLSSFEKESLFTETTVTASAVANPASSEDILELNGCPVSLKDDAKSENSNRYQRVLSIFREQNKRRTTKHDNFSLRIISDNNFPTAAGLASSASGFAALTFALKYVFDVPESFNASCVARQGSGSACRSMQGGFVRWSRNASLQHDMQSSCIEQLFDENYWPNLCCLVCVLKSDQKTTGSTAGMRRAHTSPLFAERLQKNVPERIARLTDAIESRDFAAFGTVAMDESDELHQVCETSDPPLFYLTDASRSIIELVRTFNDSCGVVRAAYTFDAGPNAFLFFERENAKTFLSCLYSLCDVKSTKSMPSDLLSVKPAAKDSTRAEKQSLIAVETIIVCKVGSGPQLLCYCDCSNRT